MEKESIAKRNSILDYVRNFIGTIAFFSESEIIMKPRRIAINNDKFYFSFDSKTTFNMGFTCGEESIDSLNNVMNEVAAKLTKKLDLKEKFSIVSFTVFEFIVDKECDLFSKLIQQKNLSEICSKDGVVSPKKIDLECKSADGNSSFELSFFRRENQNWLRIEFTKYAYTQLAINAANETANLIREIASRVSKNLLVKTS
jgi:hypothetical protein